LVDQNLTQLFPASQQVTAGEHLGHHAVVVVVMESVAMVVNRLVISGESCAEESPTVVGGMENHDWDPWFGVRNE
jgi:hypothetical protein